MANEETIIENDAAIAHPETEQADNESAAVSESAAAECDQTEIIGVQFRSGGKIYYFSPNGLNVPEGEAVIVETSRGLEYGICRAANHMVKSSLVIPPLRSALRIATEEDSARRRYNESREKDAFNVCLERINSHHLAMKLIEVEYTFDNSKLLFYFTADGRVDFRELVKDLAAIFRTRIEMRQVGIRDEARQLGGLGVCGRPFCCATFLADFGQVSIHMAKDQNLSLNSAKISGSCGRLMCCLRFEYETYADALKKMPPLESFVITPDGKGVVTELSALAGLVKVRLDPQEDNNVKVYKSEDVKTDPDRVFVRPEEEEYVPVSAETPSYRSYTEDRSVIPDRGRGEKKSAVRNASSAPEAPEGKASGGAGAPEDMLDGIDYSNYDESINEAPLPDAPPAYFRDRTRYRPDQERIRRGNESAGEQTGNREDDSGQEASGNDDRHGRNRPFPAYRGKKFDRNGGERNE